MSYLFLAMVISGMLPLGGCKSVSVLTAPKQTQLQSPVVQVPLQFDDEGHPLVEVMINGQGPFTLVLDTGASFSWFPKDLAEQLQLPSGPVILDSSGPVPQEQTTVKIQSMELGGALFKNLVASAYPGIGKYRYGTELLRNHSAKI